MRSTRALLSAEQPSEDQSLESAWKQIIPWLTGRGSIRCIASNWLEFNYVKNELRLKDGNKQGALMFYSSHTPKIPPALNNSSNQIQQPESEVLFHCCLPFKLEGKSFSEFTKIGVSLIILLREANKALISEHALDDISIIWLFLNQGILSETLISVYTRCILVTVMR